MSDQKFRLAYTMEAIGTNRKRWLEPSYRVCNTEEECYQALFCAVKSSGESGWAIKDPVIEELETPAVWKVVTE